MAGRTHPRVLSHAVGRVGGVVFNLASLVFPARCPGCGVEAEPVCTTCRSTVRAAPNLAIPVGLDSLVVPFAYDGIVRELVARAKYRQRHAALDWLAGEMVAVLAPKADRIDVVTWAPTTARRRRNRGFDQAEVLAARIGSGLGTPVRPRLRRRSGAAQTGANRATRAHRPEFVPLASPRPSHAHESVLVVDDVVTTGATMVAAARALRQGGANRVIGAAAARRA